jgi:hypothetical protein
VKHLRLVEAEVVRLVFTDVDAAGLVIVCHGGGG